MTTGFLKGSWLVAAALFCLGAQTLWAQASFLPLQVLTNGGARVRLNIPTGVEGKIDISTNLQTWLNLLTSTGSLTHTDAFTTIPSLRAYRAEIGDRIQTTNGDVTICPVTHASFVLSWNGRAIYNDPDTANYSYFKKADLILIGHEHSDHFDAATIGSVRATNGFIVVPQAVYNLTAFAPYRGSAIILTNGASTNLFGIDILAVPAYNANHPRGRDNGYVVTMGGKRFYMSGDTSSSPEMNALTNIDVAFLAMNSFTMTASEAAIAAQAFRPKIAYPYHYSGSLGNPAAFREAIPTNSGIEVRLRNWYP